MGALKHLKLHSSRSAYAAINKVQRANTEQQSKSYVRLIIPVKRELGHV